MTALSIGVEEEFHLVDADTGQLCADVSAVLQHAPDRANVEPELLRTQIETGTSVCATLGELRAELVRARRDVVASAARAGCRVAAGGTWPGAAPSVPVTEQPRYEAIADRFGPIAREATVCGCHVHVGVDDPELVVAVVRRSRPWLPVLLALSANSPFWRGADTGYASYRSQVWARWPTAGPPPVLRSRAEYDEVVAALLATGVMRDEGMLYWDVRASRAYPTVEFRVADVCLSVDDAVLLAGLVRALVRTCAEAQRADRPAPDVRPEVLRAALWRAARSGLRGELVDPCTGEPLPAHRVVHRLLDHVSEALAVADDTAVVEDQVRRVLAEGTGAEHQRAAYGARGRIDAVVDLLVTSAEADR